MKIQDLSGIIAVSRRSRRSRSFSEDALVIGPEPPRRRPLSLDGWRFSETPQDPQVVRFLKHERVNLPGQLFHALFVIAFKRLAGCNRYAARQLLEDYSALRLGLVEETRAADGNATQFVDRIIKEVEARPVIKNGRGWPKRSDFTKTIAILQYQSTLTAVKRAQDAGGGSTTMARRLRSILNDVGAGRAKVTKPLITHAQNHSPYLVAEEIMAIAGIRNIRSILKKHPRLATSARMRWVHREVAPKK